MSSSSHKSDDGGGSLSNVGYFKAAHFKISSDDSFRDFLEAYRLEEPSSFTPTTLCWDLLFPCCVSSKKCFAP
ncbi:hypothetical protein ACFX16_029923 [Malus domestica]